MGKDLLKRVTVVYLFEESYRKIQSILKLRGSNFSKWVREKIEEEIANE